MVHSGLTEAGPIITITTTYWPVDPPHPLNDANILYGIYDNGVVKKECCIVKNFSKTGVSQQDEFASRVQDEFASRMQEKGFSNLCLEVYAYDKHTDTLICERFESTLMSWTKKFLETPRKRDIWKEQDNSISGRSLLRPLFGFLMVYPPERYYHPDLLNSVYIIAENKVKFLSKVTVDSRPPASENNNLSEVLSFIYGISVGDMQQVSKKIGDPKFAQPLPESSAHIPKSLQNLYKYLQS
ncbi:hypothetical protein SLEP1_g20959 [Rubroshorea leprosula]|uniref:Uncharacterized protein n=1 Tax=Rubroshorea leprosula TaxID=152421 RepID=A0AAV5J7L9_9ROSI|nr:hypothetical protein SLEP1_g20959 [Rubroshorea leprosula]